MTHTNYWDSFDCEIQSDEMGYKAGQKIKILRMEGEPQYSNREGTIHFVDSIGQLHGDWGGLAVNPRVDDFILID